MIDHIEILLLDYRGCITDIAVEDYFQIILFEIDKVDNSRLNSQNYHAKQNLLKKLKN